MKHIEYKNFIIVDYETGCKFGVRNNVQPRNFVYFGSFDSEYQAKVLIDMLYYIMMDYCDVAEPIIP